MGTSNAARNAANNKTFASPHTGPTLINKIEKQMDGRRVAMKNLILEHGANVRESPVYFRQRGRYEGLAGSLAILRSTNLKTEMDRSNERLGIT